jgi:hypothetical protein
MVDEDLREKMGEAFENGNNAVALKLSQELDVQIVEFMQQDSQTSSN